MFNYSHSVETAASPDTIWQFYCNTESWPEWDSSVQSVSLDGPFAVGTTGTMVIEGQPPLPMHLTEVTPDRSFTDVTDLPEMGLVVTFIHLLEPLPGGGTRVTHRMELSGPAAETLGPEVGPMIVADVPDAMRSLVAKAEAALVH